MIKVRDVNHADISHDYVWEYIQPNPLKDLERGPFCLFEFKKFKLGIYIFKYICISLIKFINFDI